MGRSLPRSKDELRGMRAAGWIRESTDEQQDNYGPDAQERRIRRAVGKFGMADTGLRYMPVEGVSGSVAWKHPEMLRLVADAKAGRFELLVVAYTSRVGRNVKETLDLIGDDLHPAGVPLYVENRNLLSSDPDDYHVLVDEANDAMKFATDLSRSVRDGYEAKFLTYNDQAGNAPLGLHRVARVVGQRKGEPVIRKFLEIDPETIGIVRSIFEKYASGVVSITALANEFGLGIEQVRKCLQNEIYIGFARRHRDYPDADRRAAPWRSAPPISDELWTMVQEVRSRRTKGGGPRRTDRFDPLRGVLFCVCGIRIRTDGTMGTPPRRRKIHPGTCAEWGTQISYPAETWEAPVLDQLRGMRIDDGTVARVIQALSFGHPVPIDFDERRRVADRKKAADLYSTGSLSLAEFVARVEALKDAAAPLRPQVAQIQPERAVHWLQNLHEAIAYATPDLLTELTTTVYDRIEVRGREIVAIHLTPTASAHGLALTLPERVSVQWRPRQGSNLRPSA